MSKIKTLVIGTVAAFAVMCGSAIAVETVAVKDFDNQEWVINCKHISGYGFDNKDGPNWYWVNVDGSVRRYTYIYQGQDVGQEINDCWSKKS